MTVSVKTRQQQKKGGDKSLGEGEWERMALLLSPERCMLLLRLDPKDFGARTWGVSSCSSCSEWIKASSFLRACSETRHRETWSRLRRRWRWRLRLIILQFCERDRATGSIWDGAIGDKVAQTYKQKHKDNCSTAKDERTHGQYRYGLTSERYEAGQVFAWRQFGVLWHSCSGRRRRTWAALMPSNLQGSPSSTRKQRR